MRRLQRLSHVSTETTANPTCKQVLNLVAFQTHAGPGATAFA